MEFYKISIRYLQQCNIKVSESFFRKRMQSHSDYPSLVSFTDTLDEVNLPYSAVIIDKEKYKELQYPLLAHSNVGETEYFLLVSSAVTFEKDNSALLKKWSGIAVMIEPGSQINYEEHTESLKMERFQSWHRLLLVFCFAFVFLSAGIYHFTVTNLFLILLSVAGVTICILIILRNMGVENAIIKQLCSADVNHGCNKVLNSKVSNLWKGISLVDLGLVYFSGVSLFLLASTVTNVINNANALLLLPVSLSILLSSLSIWYQWKIVKSWCKMCLIVAGIVWLQATVLLTTYNLSSIISIAPITFFYFFISLIVPAALWLNIKSLILKSDELIKTEIDLLRWKRNPETFLLLLYNQRKVDVIPWKDDIILGSQEAQVQIMVACNPYCSPCAKVHQMLENLLHTHQGRVGLTVRFLLNANDNKDRRTIAASHIRHAINHATQLEKSGAKSPLDNWFEIMDIDKFKEIYPEQPVAGEFENWLQRQEAWNIESNITYTPTVFINGYEMSKNYKVSDLNLLLNQIAENITPLAAVANAAK